MHVKAQKLQSEAWYGLTKNHINELANIYKQLLRKITGCPSKTPVCLLYLELGLQPIEFILKSRKLGFLKYILDQDKTTLLSTVFHEQNTSTRKG